MIVIIIILLLIVLFLIPKIEGYSQGALTQLFAKGPQDLYLTGPSHVFPYNYPFDNWYYPYGYTRMRKSQRLPYFWF